MINNFPILHFIDRMKVADSILTKIEKQAEYKHIAEADIFAYQFIDDMFAFGQQVGSIAMQSRLIQTINGTQFNSIDTKGVNSFATGHTYLQTAISELENMDPEDLNKLDTKTVYLPFLPETGMPADQFMSMTLANFEFHVASMYNLARMNGFEIGKMDYLGMN